MAVWSDQNEHRPALVSVLPQHGLQTFYGNEPHPLLSAGSRAARGKLTISGVPACLNYCEIFIVCKQFANVVMGRVIQPGGPQVRDPCRVSADIHRIVCL